MSKRTVRMITEAIQTKRPVLVNPSEEEIRAAAERLRGEGRLICTACRSPIEDALYRSERISLGDNIQAVAHLHMGCATDGLRTTQ